MSSVSTHVLDAVTGAPAAGLAVRLLGPGGPVADEVTDDDGRVPTFGAARLPGGTYRLVFDTGAWFARAGVESFYPEVTVTFAITVRRHHHVPLLLSPYSYTTYRGS